MRFCVRFSNVSIHSETRNQYAAIIRVHEKISLSKLWHEKVITCFLYLFIWFYFYIQYSVYYDEWYQEHTNSLIHGFVFTYYKKLLWTSSVYFFRMRTLHTHKQNATLAGENRLTMLVHYYATCSCSNFYMLTTTVTLCCSCFYVWSYFLIRNTIKHLIGIRSNFIHFHINGLYG